MARVYRSWETDDLQCYSGLSKTFRRDNVVKKNKLIWMILRFFAWAVGDYKPPYGSIGHSIQSGKITEEEARAYLDATS